MGERPELPRRAAGTHLPAEAYQQKRTRQAARGPRSAGVPPEGRWATGEPALRLLLNGLRRWEQANNGRGRGPGWRETER